MHDDLYEEMTKKYPNLYRMNTFIECGPGWFPLLDDLSKGLELMILELKLQQGKDILEIEEDSELPCVTQVKEKYGSLRFYMSEFTDNMEELIEKAEKKSSETCEGCGKKGRVVSECWHNCVCEDCS